MTNDQDIYQQERLKTFGVLEIVLVCMSLGFLGFGLMGLVGFVKATANPTGQWVPWLGSLLVAILFGGVGAAVGFLAFHSIREDRKENRARKRTPDAPWRWREQWRDGLIEYSPWPPAYFWIAVAVFCNLLIWGGMTLFILDGAAVETPGVFLILGGFVICGLGIFRHALREIRNARSYGIGRLQLADFPAVVGETIQGCIDFGLPSNSEDGHSAAEYFATLRCTYQQTRRPPVNIPIWGKQEIGDPQSYEVPLFEKTLVVPAQQSSQFPGKKFFAFEFAIPPNALSSNTTTRSGDAVEWEIRIQDACNAASSHKGLDARFEIPVFRTQQQPVQFDLPVPIRETRSPSLAEITGQAGGTLVHDREHSLEFEFRALPFAPIPMSQEAMCVLWFVMSLGILLTDLVWGIGFIAIGVWTAGFIYKRSRSLLKITANSQQLTVQSGGFRTVDNTWRTAEIASIGATQVWKHGQMSEAVVVEDHLGGSTPILTELPTRFAGHQLAARIAKACLPDR